MKKILLVLIIMIFITGCGSSLVGTYKLIEMVEEGETISQETIDNMNIELEVVSDTEAILKTGGTTQKFRIENHMFIDDKEVKQDNSVEEKIGIPFTTSENKIILSNETDKMVFEKK